MDIKLAFQIENLLNSDSNVEEVDIQYSEDKPIGVGFVLKRLEEYPELSSDVQEKLMELGCDIHYNDDEDEECEGMVILK